MRRTKMHGIFSICFRTLFTWEWNYRWRQHTSEQHTLYILSYKHEVLKSLVGFDVLMAVAVKSTIFWEVTPCSLIEIYRRFGGTQCVLLVLSRHIRGSLCFFPAACFFGLLFDNKFLRNVDKLLQDYTASHKRRFYSLKNPYMTQTYQGQRNEMSQKSYRYSHWHTQQFSSLPYLFTCLFNSSKASYNVCTGGKKGTQQTYIQTGQNNSTCIIQTIITIPFVPSRQKLI
jgi:hypothetical protein